MNKKTREKIAALLKVLGTKEQIMKMLESLPEEAFDIMIDLAIKLLEEEA